MGSGTRIEGADPCEKGEGEDPDTIAAKREAGEDAGCAEDGWRARAAGAGLITTPSHPEAFSELIITTTPHHAVCTDAVAERTEMHPDACSCA